MDILTPSSQLQWMNVEITGEINHEENMPGAPKHLPSHYAFYARGGRHSACSGSDLICCDGSAYKADIFPEGKTEIKKEMWHEEYASDRGEASHGFSMKGKWVGFKFVIMDSGSGHVDLESYYETSGNNSWKIASKTNDTGGWGTPEKKGCMNHKTGKQRGKDDILLWSGPMAVFRSDYAKYTFRNLSVREICPSGGCSDKDHFKGCDKYDSGCAKQDCHAVF